jgi:hypothetical protein
MPKKITKQVCAIAAVLVTLLLLAGCDNGRAGNPWKTLLNGLPGFGWIEKRPTFSDLERIFVGRSAHLKEGVELCEKYPAIRRIGSNNEEDVSYYKGVPLPLGLASDVTAFRKILIDIPASSLHCGRRGDYEGDPLATVTFVVYSVGLSVSGSSMSIMYSTPWSRQHNPWTEEQRVQHGYRALEAPSWYAVED